MRRRDAREAPGSGLCPYGAVRAHCGVCGAGRGADPLVALARFAFAGGPLVRVMKKPAAPVLVRDRGGGLWCGGAGVRNAVCGSTVRAPERASGAPSDE